MTIKNRRMVEEYLTLSGYDIEDARADLRRKRYSRAMVHVASSIEYSGKAAVLAVGVEPEKDHRVALHKHRANFPKDFRDMVDVWDDDSARTQEFVVRARYGSRAGDTLPSEIFRDAGPVEERFRAAERTRDQVAELVRALGRGR